MMRPAPFSVLLDRVERRERHLRFVFWVILALWSAFTVGVFFL
jgi:hypothetical protein